jgi:hypothetical protein
MIILVKSFYLFEATIEHFVILSVSCLQCRHRFCLWDKQWKCKPLVLQILSLYVRSQPAVATHTHKQTDRHLVSRIAAKVGGVEQIRASSLSSPVRCCHGRERTTEFLHTENGRRRKWVFNNILLFLDAH